MLSRREFTEWLHHMSAETVIVYEDSRSNFVAIHISSKYSTVFDITISMIIDLPCDGEYVDQFYELVDLASRNLEIRQWLSDNHSRTYLSKLLREFEDVKLCIV